MKQNVVLPTQLQLNTVTPIFQAVAKYNPLAARTALEAQGFDTQGVGDTGLFNIMLLQYAANKFDPSVLSGVSLGMTDGKTIYTSDAGNNKTVQQWIADIGAGISTALGDGNVQTPPNQNQSADLIAGMQKSTIYMIAGLAVIVIALIIFLSLKKK
jgi:hypothetical protein